MKVLLICPSCSSIEKMMEHSKGTIELVAAQNARQGFDLLNSGDIDLVFVHLKLMDRDTMQTVRDIREAYPDIRMVAAVDNHFSEVVSFLEEMNFSEILQSPEN